jgi:phosphotriesterase-related protein
MEMDDFDDLKIILWLILFLVFGIIIITCKPVSKEYIMTVNGPESPGKMGITLEHEHILVDFIGADSTGYLRWNRDSVISRIVPFLNEAKEKGVRTFVDCTPSFLGRDPWLLKEISMKTGLIILTNTGYYGALKNKFIPKEFYGKSAETLASEWASEFQNGIEESGVKPGFIKIAVENDSVISEDNIKIVKAAGLAHLKTGLTIVSHTGPDHLAFRQIDILKDLGVDPSAFIWTHASRGTIEGNIKAAKEGVWISLDKVKYNPEAVPGSSGTIKWFAERIIELKKQGLLNRVLLSHDSGWYEPGKPRGGNISGFTDIFNYLIPELEREGITKEEIDQIMVKNPQEAFRVRIRRL